MKHKIDYFGYVYQWTNLSNGKMYIGSHYGSVEDYYIGSGKDFKPAYDKNPELFKMSILEFVGIDNKKEILNCEQKWLNSIPNIKNNNNYYNLINKAGGGWEHITLDHLQLRANTLKEKHIRFGLSDSERASYNKKIQTRLDRIAKTGFTEKEKEQHAKYGYKIEITFPSGERKIYKSCGEASRELNIDVQYGLKVCIKKIDFKGYKIIKLQDPIVDCR